jgi:hypothetical protein
MHRIKTPFLECVRFRAHAGKNHRLLIDICWGSDADCRLLSLRFSPISKNRAVLLGLAVRDNLFTIPTTALEVKTADYLTAEQINQLTNCNCPIPLVRSVEP